MSFIARVSETTEGSGVVFPAKSVDEFDIKQGETVYLEFSEKKYVLAPVSNIESGLGALIPEDLVDELQLQPSMKLHVQRKDDGISMRVLTKSFSDWMQCKTCSGTFREGR
ncbi:MAG: hypothetical protein EA363_05345 [Balneolaceae bacterium]|nr:MAG: hypothetical protein EA363_05345 [Balneolaceae bacterium]